MPALGSPGRCTRRVGSSSHGPRGWLRPATATRHYWYNIQKTKWGLGFIYHNGNTLAFISYDLQQPTCTAMRVSFTILPYRVRFDDIVGIYHFLRYLYADKVYPLSHMPWSHGCECAKFVRV